MVLRTGGVNYAVEYKIKQNLFVHGYAFRHISGTPCPWQMKTMSRMPGFEFKLLYWNWNEVLRKSYDCCGVLWIMLFFHLIYYSTISVTEVGWVVCQDHVAGNFNGAVKPMKSAKMMSQDITQFAVFFFQEIMILCILYSEPHNKIHELQFPDSFQWTKNGPIRHCDVHVTDIFSSTGTLPVI